MRAPVRSKAFYKYPQDVVRLSVDHENKKHFFIQGTFKHWTYLKRSDAKAMVKWLTSYLHWSQSTKHKKP